MAKIKYGVKENTKTGTHSWYAVPIFNGTLSFNELCEEACEDNTYSVEEMTGCVSKFMKVVQREAARGFRCKLGTDFLTLFHGRRWTRTAMSSRKRKTTSRRVTAM